MPGVIRINVRMANVLPMIEGEELHMDKLTKEITQAVICAVDKHTEWNTACIPCFQDGLVAGQGIAPPRNPVTDPARTVTVFYDFS